MIRITNIIFGKDLVSIDYNVGAMYRLGLRSTELSIYNNFKNENEC